ncbi:unnamed protein product [Brachionus calyciflorus]|uniref:Uncharacterized protein n=1 Tax=Brachionus calyciflorus TaxID=104777 RepID=A0A813WE73_9BILA|nr:unnamed protein product [Brachionus calyciflorus]
MKLYSLGLLIVIILFDQSRADLFSFKPSSNRNDFDDKCFCKLREEVDDCECKIESIDKLNNYQVHPRINTIVQKDYFRFIKLNLNKICQFWTDDARCSLKDCHVKSCNQDDLPASFRNIINQQDENAQAENCEQSNPLGHINSSLSDESIKAFEDMKKYDDAQDNFCEPDDETHAQAEYLDLVLNPERFTGYKAPHAHKIWNSIYRENCFENTDRIAYGPEKNTCLEKRFFYRLVSGLHTSINVHLSARFLHKGLLDQADVWGPNPEEFKKRFDPETTNGLGPQWLKNLYFIYLVELRALAKVAPYLEKETFYAGRSQVEDEEAKFAVLDLLKTIKNFQYHFNETRLFRGNPIEAKTLKEEFQTKFRNITRIMDCVGCDKCRLWGKVQTLALGTSLKILFSGKISSDNANSKNSFQLTRTEIVALFNGFARLSNSIAEIENFRELLSRSTTETKTILKNQSKIDL